MAEEKTQDPLSELEATIKEIWLRQSGASVVSARHTEFVVEPKIFIGDKLNPEILKLLVLNYLSKTSVQDSGLGNVEIKSDKLIIKSPKGKPLVIVTDQKIVHQYLAAQA
jgi:hypothetical protein